MLSVRPPLCRPNRRAAVADEVELDVAAAPVGLEVALALAVGRVAAALHDRQVGRQEGIADGAHHREAALEAEFGEVVEEDAADAARLVAVLEEEVLVAPVLEARVLVVAEGRQRVAAAAVEVRARLPRSRSRASGPCRRRTRPPARGPPAARRTCARSCAPWARSGLRGCITSDTPIASKGAPASSGRCWVADGGIAGPRTWLKLQPPRSKHAALLDQARQAVALQAFARGRGSSRRRRRHARPRPATRRRWGPAGRAGRCEPRSCSWSYQWRPAARSH